MSFDFGVMNKIKILKGGKDDLDIGDGGTVEEVYVDRQPSISEVLNSSQFVKGEPSEVTSNDQPKQKENVVAEEVKPSQTFSDFGQAEEQENTETSTAVTNPCDTDYLSVIRRRLGVDDTEHVEVYVPSILSAKPLDFKEIKDTKGLISAKVSKFELESGLSCMPFSLIGLNKNIVEIKDYHIATVGKEKYVSSSTRISNKQKIAEYTERWKEKIESAEEIEENLMEIVSYNGQQVKTIAFNQAELDHLLSLFNQVNAALVIHGDDVIFMAGV